MGRVIAWWSSAAVVGGLVVGCGGKSNLTGPPPPPPLPLVAAYALGIPEPSDVTINESGTTLWMVGNHPEKVYQFTATGTLVKTLAYTGQDLEGIAYDPRDTTLWVAEENLRRVVHLDRDGAVLSRHSLGLTGEHNSGLEGICLNASGQLFVLNEKRPGLFIALDQAVAIGSIDTLTFARDYSGITYNTAKQCFWIVSDQSQRLYLWNPTQSVLAEYSLPFEKPEGVAFDPVADLIYVVSDATNTLYVFRGTAGSVPAGAW